MPSRSTWCVGASMMSQLRSVAMMASTVSSSSGVRPWCAKSTFLRFTNSREEFIAVPVLAAVSI
eukprot:1177177-Rhodomonas_salina.5